MKTSSKVFLWTLAVFVTLVWGLKASNTPKITPADLGSLFSGWAFLGLIGTLLHNQAASTAAQAANAAAQRVTNEMLYLQAVAGQMNAYGVLAQFAGDHVMCENFKKRMIALAGEFELAKHRAAEPLGIVLP